MNSAPTFEFIAGSLSFCLVDTLGGRGGVLRERLGSPEDLTAWMCAAGLLSVKSIAGPTKEDLGEAVLLRDAIHRCGLALIRHTAMPSADVRRINACASKAPLRPQMRGGAIVLTAPNLIEAALSTIAADAITTLSGPSRERIRVCPGCQMMFVDTSRPGKRRWCSSATGCGNRAKVQKHRRRGAGLTASRGR